MTAARPGAPIDPAALPADGFWVKTARVLRMTAVRLSILYFVVFTVFSVFLVVLVSHDAARIMSRSEEHTSNSSHSSVSRMPSSA